MTADIGHGTGDHADETTVVDDDQPADHAVVHHDSHGQTPAAWTTVGLIMLAILLGGIAVLLGNWTLFWIGGVGLTVVGALVGKVMAMLGYGKNGPTAGDSLPTDGPPD